MIQCAALEIALPTAECNVVVHLFGRKARPKWLVVPWNALASAANARHDISIRLSRIIRSVIGCNPGFGREIEKETAG
jgi:hypothetical protein